MHLFGHGTRFRYPAELEAAAQKVFSVLSPLLPDIATPQETIECWAEQRQGAWLSNGMHRPPAKEGTGRATQWGA